MCAEAGPEGGEACLVKVRQTTPSKCPVCRTALPRDPIRNLSAEHSIAALPATCRHCPTAITRGELLGHEARCPRAPARCAAGADGCRWKGRAGEREAHEATCLWGRATPPPILNRSNQCTQSLNKNNVPSSEFMNVDLARPVLSLKKATG
jgi:hypothetical protein